MAKPFIPPAFQRQFLFFSHGHQWSGHPGVNKATKRARGMFWWPGISADLEKYIHGCGICNALRGKATDSGQAEALSTDRPLAMVSLDYIGPRRIRGERVCILVIIDHYSRWMTTSVSSSESSEHSSRAVEELLFAAQGPPELLLCDKGTAFTAPHFLRVCATWRVPVTFASTQYPQGNGVNESCHRLFEHILKTLEPLATGECTVREAVARATWIYNALPHSVTGQAPITVLTGRAPRIPGLPVHPTELPEAARLAWLEYERCLERGRLTTLRKTNPQKVLPDGHLATYELTDRERRKLTHVVGEKSWSPRWSLPCRIMSSAPHRNVVTLAPIWTPSARVHRPLTQVKLLPDRTDPLLDSLATILLRYQESVGLRPVAPANREQRLHDQVHRGLRRQGDVT